MDLFGKPEMLNMARVPEGRSSRQRRLERIRLSSMHRLHGPGPDGITCKGCVHLVYGGGNVRRFLKCELYRISRCESTDWRAKWPACGKYEARS